MAMRSSVSSSYTRYELVASMDWKAETGGGAVASGTANSTTSEVN